MQAVRIFTHTYIFTPLHDALHWSLAVVCHPASRPPYVLCLDSLESHKKLPV